MLQRSAVTQAVLGGLNDNLLLQISRYMSTKHCENWLTGDSKLIWVAVIKRFMSFWTF